MTKVHCKAQFPQHLMKVSMSFKALRIKLIASYHGMCNVDDVTFCHNELKALHGRVALPIKISKGGMALRCIDYTYMTAFICPMAASVPDLAKCFPLGLMWIEPVKSFK